MKSLVLELQSEAYEVDSSISRLLRKAYIVARKLKINEFEKWIRLELNGYKCDYNDIPDYRLILGETKAWNPYHGWIPVVMDDSKLEKLLTTRRLAEPITSLEVYCKKEDGKLSIPYNGGMRATLAEICGFDSQYSMIFDKTQIESIIESVRNIVLEWSLKLEEDGILGEGMQFTNDEKKIANQRNYTTNIFNGNVSNSQIQQNTKKSNQTMNVEQFDIDKADKLLKLIKENLKKIDLNESDNKQFKKQLDEIEKGLKSRKPNENKILQAFGIIKNILEGITGSLIASGILHEISQLM